jgi:hypothetical protein
MILRHKWASMYVPAVLLLYSTFALWQAQYTPDFVTVFVAVGSGYLAWHYTGQVWGMMASYTYLEGARFDTIERWLIRGSLRILLVWHLTWFVYHNVVAINFGPVYQAMNYFTLVALLLGGVGLMRMRRRIGKSPPLRALVAWLAIFVWYAALARDPKALFWIQIAHALQYLEFPVRVELNRHTATAAGRVAGRMVLYGSVLLGVSLFMGLVVPRTAMDLIGASMGQGPGQVAPILLLSFINIHHYFTDGVIWKISNPAVRKELFAHVPRPEAVPAPVQAAAPPGASPRQKGAGGRWPGRLGALLLLSGALPSASLAQHGQHCSSGGTPPQGPLPDARVICPSIRRHTRHHRCDWPSHSAASLRTYTIKAI